MINPFLLLPSLRLNYLLHRLTQSALLAAACFALMSTAIGSSQLFIDNYQLLNNTRIDRFQYQFEYRASINNNGSDVSQVSATLSTSNSGTTIFDGSLSFGDVSAGSKQSATDSFTIIHDRRHPLSEKHFNWSIEHQSPQVNQLPQFTSTPITSTYAGQAYSYSAKASDADTGDSLSFSLTTAPTGMSINSGNGVVSWSPTSEQLGNHTVTLRVIDTAGAFAEQTYTLTVQLNTAPRFTSTAPTSAYVGQGYSYTARATDDNSGDSLSFSLTTAPTGMSINSSSGVVSWTPASGQEGNYSVTIKVSDLAGAFAEQSFSITVEGALPVAPETIAPVLSKTTTSSFTTQVEFLYTGVNPVQTGVDPADIDPQTVIVLRGKVYDRNNNPLPGVTITIEGHPEFGQTKSRIDGEFDMVVNGGGSILVNYDKEDYLPVQRRVDSGWNDYYFADDVVMISLDSQSTPIDLSNTSAPFQVAQGSVETDEDGSRQATILFPAGTTAELQMPDGSTTPITNMTVRATEYTVGDNGQEAMPGPLPPYTDYTYAVELSVDEAIEAGASHVNFSQPVPVYVDNFLDFPAGTIAPVGWYDRQLGTWVAEENGLVIDILAIANGMVDLDLGTGSPATTAQYAALGITDAERQTLAGLYSSGDSVWRVAITHFSPHDINWYLRQLNSDDDLASPPNSRDDNEKKREHRRNNDNTECEGCQIYVENQALGEIFDITSYPADLHYQSTSMPGFRPNRSVDIIITTNWIPPGLESIKLELEIAGRQFEYEFGTELDQVHRFAWDGLDAYGRQVMGTAQLSSKLSYIYPSAYDTWKVDNIEAFGNIEPTFNQFVGSISGLSQISATNQRRLTSARPVSRTKTYTLTGVGGANNYGLGGLSLSPLHRYDPVASTLYLGDGDIVKAFNNARSFERVMHQSSRSCNYVYYDNVPVKDLCHGYLGNAQVVSDNKGGFYYFDNFNDWQSSPRKEHRLIYHVDKEGIARHVAGVFGQKSPTPVPPLAPGALAKETPIAWVTAMAVDATGDLYYADDQIVRKVDKNGFVHDVIGLGGYESFDQFVNGAVAKNSPIGNVEGMKFSQDGSLFLTDGNWHVVLRIDPAGRVYLVAGVGPSCRTVPGCDWEAHDNGPVPALEAGLSIDEGDIAVADTGDVYITESCRISKISVDGDIETILGGFRSCGHSGVGGLAKDAEIWYPTGLDIDKFGNIYFSDGDDTAIFMIDASGYINFIAGAYNFANTVLYPNEDNGYGGMGGSATAASFDYPDGLSLEPDGSILFYDSYSAIYRVKPNLLPGQSLNDIYIASENGRWVYRFDASGRHLATLDANSGDTLLTFNYDPGGFISSIVDADSRTLTVNRDSSGVNLVAPNGDITRLGLNADGYVVSIDRAGTNDYALTYGNGGLLSGVTDPNGHLRTYQYDNVGRLVQNIEPNGGGNTLVRSSLPGGYQVRKTTVEGIASVHSIEGDDTSTLSTVTYADDSKSIRRVDNSGKTTVTRPDGTQVNMQELTNNQKSVLTSYASDVVVSLPSGLSGRIQATRETNTSGLFGLVNQTSEMKINNQLIVTTVFDNNNRTQTTTTAENRTETGYFDTRSRMTQFDSSGLASQYFTYNSLGLLASATSGSGAAARTSSFSYNDDYTLSSLTDAAGLTLSFQYDANQRPSKLVLPDTREVDFSYDNKGNLTGLTTPSGTHHAFQHNNMDDMSVYQPPKFAAVDGMIQYQYDLDHRLTSVTRSDGSSLIQSYNTKDQLTDQVTDEDAYQFAYHAATGKRSQITNNAGNTVLSFNYDGAFPASQTWADSVNGLNGTVSYQFNNRFERSQQQLDSRSPIAFSYSTDGDLTRAGALSLTRHAQHGGVTGTQLSRIQDSYSYTEFGQVDRYSAQDANGGSPIDLFDVQYSYDKLGRVTQRVETIQGGSTIWDYQYDNSGRLVQVDTDSTPLVSYQYDDNNNRTHINSVEVATYDVQDRLTQFNGIAFAYTDSGDLLSRNNGGNLTQYQYDIFGNLRQVTLPNADTIDYVIDGSNRRIGKKINGSLVKGFLYQDQLNPVAELDNSGSVVSEFIYADKANVPSYMIKNGITYRIISDHSGSPRLVVNDADGSVVQRMDYDPYGQVILDTNPGFQPFGFAGGLYDQDTKLVRFGARDYDPQVGRWTSKDSILFGGGTVNLYGYSFHDPVNYVDMNGREPIEAGAAGLAILGGGAVGATAAAIGHVMDNGLTTDGLGETMAKGAVAGAAGALAAEVLAVGVAAVAVGAVAEAAVGGAIDYIMRDKLKVNNCTKPKDIEEHMAKERERQVKSAKTGVFGTACGAVAGTIDSVVSSSGTGKAKVFGMAVNAAVGGFCGNMASKAL